MGTNFYTVADPVCDNPAHTERLHIGKSSAGWKFGFRAYRDRDLVSWEAWRLFLVGRPITDESGARIELAELVERVENRTTPRDLDRPICRVTPTPEEVMVGFAGRWHPNDRDFHDPDGYDFYDGVFS